MTAALIESPPQGYAGALEGCLRDPGARLVLRTVKAGPGSTEMGYRIDLRSSTKPFSGGSAVISPGASSVRTAWPGR